MAKDILNMVSPEESKGLTDWDNEPTVALS